MQKQSAVKHEFIDGLKLIESNIEDIANGTAPPELYEYTQSKIDRLAERFQHDESLGNSRYKLYELQALLFYFQHRDSEALDFINSAVELRGRTYDRAEELIGQIKSTSEQYWANQYDKDEEWGGANLPELLQKQISNSRSLAVFLAVLHAIGVLYGFTAIALYDATSADSSLLPAYLLFINIPGLAFFSVLSSRLDPREVPSPTLLLIGAIVGFIIFFPIIGIIIAYEFLKLSWTAKKYNDGGPEAIMTNSEHREREKWSMSPKRILLRVLAIGLGIPIIVIIIAAVIASLST